MAEYLPSVQAAEFMGIPYKYFFALSKLDIFPSAYLIAIEGIIKKYYLKEDLIRIKNDPNWREIAMRTYRDTHWQPTKYYFNGKIKRELD